MIRILIACIALSGCTAADLLLGGKPGISVTPIGTQVAKEATQQLVGQQNDTRAGRDVIKTDVLKDVEAGQVENININNQEIPPWVMLLLLIGWLLPTPSSIGHWFGSLFIGNRRGAT
jgi:hypothetical protein